MRAVYSDKEILKEFPERIRNSDRKAFNILFDLLWEPMYAYASAIIMDDAIAKDMVQEVWINYWQRREEVEILCIKSYLYKAIRYRCYNHLRDTKFNKTQIEAVHSVYITPKIELEEDLTELSERINDTISGLPERCQEIFRLSRINDISNREIAERLNISQRSVENQISLALRKLRKELSIAKLFLF